MAAIEVSAQRAGGRRILPVSGAIRPRLARLGLAALDAAAPSLGAWFEPEFAGESPRLAGLGRARISPPSISFTCRRAPICPARWRGCARVARVSRAPIRSPRCRSSRVPNDSLWSASWWLDQASGRDLHARAAWDVTTGDTSVVVAVLDSGILRAHPDLGGVTAGDAGHLWTNWAEANGVPGVDDDHNGFIDDTWGWDFVSAAPAGGAPAAEDAWLRTTIPTTTSATARWCRG